VYFGVTAAYNKLFFKPSCKAIKNFKKEEKFSIPEEVFKLCKAKVLQVTQVLKATFIRPARFVFL
jgi:hypothetical protein